MKTTNLSDEIKKYCDDALSNLISSGAIPYVPYPYTVTIVHSRSNIKDKNWNDPIKITAPYNGYYRVYCQGLINGNTNTRAVWIAVDNCEVTRNAEYSSGRDFGTTGFYCQKGHTLSYASTGIQNISLRCIHTKE